MSVFHYIEFSKTGSILLNAEEKEELFDYLDRLKAENANLRELVRHMHTCLEHYEPGDTISCEQCPYDNETWGCDYERLMAKLGIEVDE